MTIPWKATISFSAAKVKEEMKRLKRMARRNPLG
jgi:hypothetical protein